MTAKKPFVTERSSPARCSPDSVIGLLLDASKRPGWQPEVISAEGPVRLTTGDSVWGRARMLGFGVEGRSVATTVSSTLYEEQVIVGVGMTVRYEVRPSDDGCLVVHHLESHLPTGFSGRVLSLLLRARLKRMQKTALARLVAQSEAGSIS
ncbi:MAG: SRPBCC family protein [Actinomycetota bacterium]|nr:SRPBCC family protein [Actinomycetota bacterium]